MPTLDERLKDYLDLKEDERRKGYTNEAVKGLVKKLGEDLASHAQDDERKWTYFKGVLDAHHHRIQNVEKEVSSVRDDVEDTKRHNLKELKRKANFLPDLMKKYAVDAFKFLLLLGVYEFIRHVAR